MRKRDLKRLGMCFVAALLASACASAPIEPATTAFDPNSLPRERASNPGVDFYPAQAVALDMNGRVSLAYSVGADGRAQHIALIESAGRLLDERAIDELNHSRFAVPSDWKITGGPSHRYRFGVIFNLRGKERVPPFDVKQTTVEITATRVPRK